MLIIEKFNKSELKELKNYLEGSQVISLTIKQFIDSLSEEDLIRLKTPLSIKQDSPVSRQGPIWSMGPKPINFDTFWIHANAEYKTYYFYTKYTYKAFTTKDKEGKIEFIADEIKLSIQRDVGFESFSKSKNNASSFEYVDEVYGMMNTSGRSKLSATGYKKSLGIVLSNTVEVYI